MSLTAIIAGLAALALANRAGQTGEPEPLEADAVRALARDTAARHGFRADVNMLVAMAWIESGFDPRAVRAEKHIDDASGGLMQTLLGTAQWLYDAFPKYRAMGRPGFDDLLDPEISMYFGAAYVDWLSTYAGRIRNEQWIVRAYNGGPGAGAQRSRQTANHWRKYQDARKRFG